MEDFSSQLIFENLLSRNADSWNLWMSGKLGIHMNALRDHLLLGEYDFNKIANIKIPENLDNVYDNIRKRMMDENPLYPDNIDSFVTTINPIDETVEGIILAGKYVVGFDFTGSNMTNGLHKFNFFYNCNFTNCNFEGSTITGTVFMKCNFTNTNFADTIQSKNRYYNCIGTNTSFEFSNLYECGFILGTYTGANFSQSLFSQSGMQAINADKSTWVNTKLLLFSFSDVSLNGSNFKRSTYLDGAFNSCNMLNLNMDEAIVACLTVTNCNYNPDHSIYFKVKDTGYYNPSISEWIDKDPTGLPE